MFFFAKVSCLFVFFCNVSFVFFFVCYFFRGGKWFCFFCMDFLKNFNFSEKKIFFLIKKFLFYDKKRGRSSYPLCLKVSLKKCSFNRKFFFQIECFLLKRCFLKVAVFSQNEKPNFERFSFKKGFF